MIMRNRKFEYKNFHEKPLLQLSPQQFADFMIDTMNKLGAEGWEMVSCVTPQVGQQLTGDLLILAKREIQPADFTDLEIALVRAFRPFIEKFLIEQYEKK